jgi:phosphonate transport system substrate-binding protein
VTSIVPYLVIPCVFLLFSEALKTSTSVKTRERRAFLALSAVALGLLTVGNFLPRKGRLTQLRIGITGGSLSYPDTRPFENAVSSLLDIPVKSVFVQSYIDAVTALGRGDAEIAWLGPFSYLRAREIYGARTIVRNTNLKGEKIYYSYIVANAKANIHKLDDLKGKAFALPDPNSTSGRIIPLYELKQAGFNLDTDIQTSYVGTHNVLDKILSGEFPAGAISSDNYNDALSKGKFHQSDLVILKISDPIPQGPFVAQNDIQDYDVLRIENAFFTVEDKDLSILNTLGIGGFAKIEDDSYNFLIPIAAELGISISELE